MSECCWEPPWLQPHARPAVHAVLAALPSLQEVGDLLRKEAINGYGIMAPSGPEVGLSRLLLSSLLFSSLFLFSSSSAEATGMLVPALSCHAGACTSCYGLHCHPGRLPAKSLPCAIALQMWHDMAVAGLAVRV